MKPVFNKVLLQARGHPVLICSFVPCAQPSSGSLDLLIILCIVVGGIFKVFFKLSHSLKAQFGFSLTSSHLLKNSGKHVTDLLSININVPPAVSS